MTETVGVVGLGNWGTALAIFLARRGHSVRAWHRDANLINDLKRTRHNPKYQSNYEFPSNITPSSDISEVSCCDTLVLAVPSSALSEVLPTIDFSSTKVVVSGVKGLDTESLLTPCALIDRAINRPQSISVALGGPSFARDLLAANPCGVVMASTNASALDSAIKVFAGSNLRVYKSSDRTGVELGGVVKNVIALAAGISDGLGMGDSTRAVIITRGLAEMSRLVVANGGSANTMAGLAGLGDLVMTASSTQSRNRTVGFRLGQGEQLAEIISSLGSVAEGVHSADLVSQLAKRSGTDMPITEEVLQIITSQAEPATAVRRLLNRPLKSE